VVEAHRGMWDHQTLFSVCKLRVPRDIPTEPRCACIEMGSFIHSVEDEMLCSSLMPDKVPYFNAPIYLQNKSVIGKVDEILGPINEVHFSVKMGEGMVASSFKKGDKVYIAGDKLLPIERFLPRPKVAGMWLFFYSHDWVTSC
jgi:H/ACA ribonucleoprotein complex subunit 1